VADPYPLPPHAPLTAHDYGRRLRRAGWTVRASYSRWVGAWTVYAARGAGTLLARGRSEAEALRHAGDGNRQEKGAHIGEQNGPTGVQGYTGPSDLRCWARTLALVPRGPGCYRLAAG